PLYQTERIEQPAITRTDDWLVFSSPSATGAWAASGSQHDGQRLALGETTAAAMVENGIRCDAIAATPSAGALITAMKEARQ
ncbi:MAG: uroporphyrinogen-III synthase, partial [Planctomycetota bacterium]|nr:uroporphyrinogen-III synthase [Planctomycetota bacterium]